MTPNVYAFIFARGGSKGVPRKNVRLADGKPLIAHAILCAKACEYVTRVIVSTDDAEIAEVAVQYGAEIPFSRPAALAGDTSSEWSAWRHALEALGCTPNSSPFDVFLSVPTTAPLRLPEDLNNCVEMIANTDADMVITVREAQRHPSFNMVRMHEENCVTLAMQPDDAIVRRQDAPPLYDITTVAYAARPAFVLQANSMFEGKVRAVCIPQERSLDIDSEYDLAIADFLLMQRKK